MRDREEATLVLDVPTYVEITPEPPKPPSLRWPVVALVLAQAVVALDLDVPVLRAAIALVTFVVLPTWLLHLKVLRMPYAFGIALLGLIVGGLALDTVLPWVGVDRPLAPAPLAITWLVVDLGLLLWKRDVPLPRPRLRRVLDAEFVLAPTLAAVSLLLSVVGAIRLNNGANGFVAVAAVVVAGAALLTLLGSRRVRPWSDDAWVLGLVAAGLLLATSLRGWYVTGHDIQAEFLAFRLTDGAQNWEMSSLPSAYNACLSVTILPTMLAQATGLSGHVVFTVLLQLVFATVPVLTYLFARRFIPRRLAVAAAVLTIAFPTFFTDMPYLVRQEIAFFFLALMLLAATEYSVQGRGRTTRPSRALVFALGLGVVLSHYSTTYVLLMALVAALIGMTVLRGGEPKVLVHPLMIAALVASTLVWAGPVTGTGGHATEVFTETFKSITGRSDGGPSSSDTSYWLLSGDETTPRERMDSYVDATLDYRAGEIPPELQVVPNPGEDVTAPELHAAAATPVKLACALVMQAFLFLGLVWLLRRRKDGSGRGGGFPREVVFLVWGAMAALGLIVTVPNLSVDYGVLRAFQQTLLVVAPVMAMGLWFLLRKPVLTAVVPVALLLVLAGTQQRIALENAGTYFDRFYVTDSAMQGIEWLGRTDRADTENERIIANRNVNVRLLALSDNRAPVSDRLFPTMLSRDGYVFVDGQILDQGESTVFWTGDLLTYTYPVDVLDRKLDLLYDAPQARVYR